MSNEITIKTINEEKFAHIDENTPPIKFSWMSEIDKAYLHRILFKSFFLPRLKGSVGSTHSKLSVLEIIESVWKIKTKIYISFLLNYLTTFIFPKRFKYSLTKLPK